MVNIEAPPALEILGLSAGYDQHPVLHEVTLSVQPGEILALVGPNGAGKSTLVRAVSGVLPRLSGQIRIQHQSILELPAAARARLLAVVPQARALPGAFSVTQTVMLGRTPYLGWLGIPARQDQSAVLQALEQTQLLGLADRRVGELSGGEQQLVLLARALCQETPVLLLDEPTTHLDLQHITVLLNLLRTLASARSLAILMVLHDLSLAGLYADRVALLVDGRVFAQGTPSAVLTEENLSAIYQVPVHVVPHPETGGPLILPLRSL